MQLRLEPLLLSLPLLLLLLLLLPLSLSSLWLMLMNKIVQLLMSHGRVAHMISLVRIYIFGNVHGWGGWLAAGPAWAQLTCTFHAI
jgi:hypothetical protein